MQYYLQIEDYFSDEWKPILAPATTDATSPTDALTHIERIPLRPGVKYRIHITADDGTSIYTEPATTPEIAKLPADREPRSIAPDAYTRTAVYYGERRDV